jgi:hypothetical protein
MRSLQLCFLIYGALLVQPCAAQTNVTGAVVDAGGKPIAGVRCAVSGFPQPSGDRIIYSGLQSFVFTDQKGQFTIPLPRHDPLVDLQFDGGGHAPVFLYKVRPADSPLRVVMSDGRLLRGRIVERVKDELVPVPHAMVELQMPQEDFWYQYRQATDAKGEFEFRISDPPGKSPWMLYFAGKRLPVDYAQVTTETIMVLEVSVKMTPSAEPNGGANAASPRRSP